MNAKATIGWTWCLLLVLATTAMAQPARNGEDAIWARDVDGAALTLDGNLDEAAWQQAESIHVSYNDQTFFTPGGGWQLQSGENPDDPVDATVYFLRDGNDLWIGVDAKDASIGGSMNFFQHDGIVLSINDHTNRTTDGFVDGAWVGDNWGVHANTDEVFYTWIVRPDFGIVDSVGIDPTYLGNEASANMPNLDKWNAAANVDGVSNDDFNGNATPTPDVGYTMEIVIHADAWGYDLTAADGDQVGLTFGIYDMDYSWPADAAGAPNRTRAWWQNPWGGDQPWGSAAVYAHPDVTINSGAAPDITEPDVRVPSVPDGESITVDGVLDEAAWSASDPVISLQYKMTPEQLDALPGYGPYYTGWFRPGGGEGAPPVIDPSTGNFHLLHQDGRLYVGLDTDDAAVSGQTDENRADGFRFNLKNLFPEEGTYTPGGNFPGLQFMVVIDSTGSATALQDGFENPAVTAAASLKGTSTAGNADDVDSGYQIEMEIDLDALGYNLAEIENQIWWGAVYFDGDDLPVTDDSYGVRTWFLGERGGNMQGARTYLDPSSTVAVDDPEGTLPTRIELLGNYPNPFNPVTTIRYALPQAGEVSIAVFDVLGRRVALLNQGMQSAGRQDVRFDGAGLASGLYLYRVFVTPIGGAEVSAEGYLTLLK